MAVINLSGAGSLGEERPKLGNPLGGWERKIRIKI